MNNGLRTAAIHWCILAVICAALVWIFVGVIG